MNAMRGCSRRIVIPSIYCVVLLLFGYCRAEAQIEGHWKGEIVRDGAATTLLLDFKRANDALTGSFGFPDQRVMEYPLQSIVLQGQQAVITGPGGAFKLIGTISGRDISGKFTDGVGEATFRASRVEQALPYTGEVVRFRNGPVELAASLYIPRGSRRFPAVLFLHGAGGEVRWGASRYFADYLARRGIAALIYDKRGSGESGGDWRKSNFEDLAGDALAALEMLRRNPRIDGRRVGIYGHSQGGTLAPLVAAKAGSDRIAFVVSAAGAAIPMWKAEIHSLRTQVRNQGVTGESLARADKFIDQLIAAVRSGNERDALAAEADLAKQRGEPWAELLSPPPPDSYFWSFYPRIADYDAAEFWRRITVPVLIVQAGRDSFVPVEESTKAMDAALRDARNPDYTIVLLPDAPHNLVLQPASQPHLKWPQLYPGFADLLAGWIKYRMSSDSVAAAPAAKK